MNHSTKLRILLLLAISLLFPGCMSQKHTDQLDKSMGELFAAPLNALVAKLNGGDDLAYTTASFKRKNNRWPDNYVELSNYVAQSEGYLYLALYERVTFSKQTNGAVTIVFIPHGRTNESTFTLEPRTLGTTNSPKNTEAIQSLLNQITKPK